MDTTYAVHCLPEESLSQKGNGTLDRIQKLKTDVQRLPREAGLVHIRDMLSHGLKRKAVCTNESITFELSPSKGW